MGSTDSTSCCTTKASGCAGGCCKCRLCSIIFKVLFIGLLACMASSLWEINHAIRMVSAVTASTGK